MYVWNCTHYARVASFTLKPTAHLFRLRRRGKRLSTEEYAENLMKYFDDSGNVNSLTLDDLNCVLSKMQSTSTEEETICNEVNNLTNH